MGFFYCQPCLRRTAPVIRRWREDSSGQLIGEQVKTLGEQVRVLGAQLQQVQVGEVKHQALGHRGTVAGSPALVNSKLVPLSKEEITKKTPFTRGGGGGGDAGPELGG